MKMTMTRRAAALLALIVGLRLGLVVANESPYPQYGHWDTKRAQAADALQTVSNMEWDETNQVGYCHLAGYLAFSRAADTECNLKQAKKIYRELAAMYMAIHHFNTGSK